MADYSPFDAWWISRGPSEAQSSEKNCAKQCHETAVCSLLETVPLVHTGPDGFHKSALALIKAGAVWHNQIMTRSNLRILFHIADDGLPAVVHMDMLNANSLLPAGTQASQNFHLHRIRLH